MPGGTFKLPLAYIASGIQVADGAMTAGSRLLSSASAAFTALMEGIPIKIEGAGVAGVDLTTRIVRRISATVVEVADAASTTVSGSDLTYAIGRVQLRRLLKFGDVDLTSYDMVSASRLRLQVNSLSPAGKIYVGGPLVTPTSAGVELSTVGGYDDVNAQRSLDDWVTANVANALLNVSWEAV